MDKFIIINDKVKIRNPCFDQNNVYSGDINNFSFTDKSRFINQQKNYQLLKDSFETYDIKLTYVWSGSCNNNLTKFLVKSENSKIFWYKYEGKTPGGGQNSLFINGNKIKLTKWLRMTSEERDQIINS